MMGALEVLLGRRGGPARLSPHAAALGFVLATCLAVLGLDGWRIWASREARLVDARVETINLAQSLAAHAERSIEIVDEILGGIVERLEYDGTGQQHAERMHRFLVMRSTTVPQIANI